MPLSQIQIIQSLGKALEWFEQERNWGVKPQELNHLTGRIGELYAAMITRGQMALKNNQQGYDVISGDNEFISVKTVTTAQHVTFNKNTFDVVDRVIVLRLNFVDEVEIEELLDCSKEDFLKDHARKSAGKYKFPTRRTTRDPKRPSHELPVVDFAEVKIDPFGNGEKHYRITRHEGGPINIWLFDGVDFQHHDCVVKDFLWLRIGYPLGLSLTNDNGNVKNTQQLGAQVIAKIKQMQED